MNIQAFKTASVETFKACSQNPTYCPYPRQAWRASDLSGEAWQAITEAFYRSAWKDGLSHDEAEEASQLAVVHMIEKLPNWPSVSRGENRKAFFTVRKYFRKSAWKGFTGLRRNNLDKKKRSEQEHDRRQQWAHHVKNTSTAPQAVENIREALDKYAQRLKDLVVKFTDLERDIIARQECSKQGPRRNRLTRSAARSLEHERRRIQAKRRTAETQLLTYHKLIAIHGTRDELARAYFGLQLADVETPTGEHLERLRTEANAESKQRAREHHDRLNAETV